MFVSTRVSWQRLQLAYTRIPWQLSKYGQTQAKQCDVISNYLPS